MAPAMANGRCWYHGGATPPTPKGNRYSLKHGCFTAEAIEKRRKGNEVLRATYALAKQTDDRVAKRLAGFAAKHARQKLKKQQQAAATSETGE